MSCEITDLPVFNSTGCGVENLISTGHIKQILITNKDEVVPDITDNTAIAALVSAGSMVLSPEVTGTLPVTTKSDPIQENCKPETNLTRERTFTFTSVRTDVDGKEDFDFWNTFDANIGDYFIALIDCDDNLYVPKAFTDTPSSQELGWVTSGFCEIDFDNTSARKWSGELTWREPFSKKVDKVILTADVKTAIGL